MATAIYLVTVIVIAMANVWVMLYVKIGLMEFQVKNHFPDVPVWLGGRKHLMYGRMLIIVILLVPLWAK
jgi:hypothetical protein